MKLPFSDITPLDKSVPGVQAIEPIILPQLSVLYARRAARLRALGDDGQPYLAFLAHLVEAQGKWLDEHPLAPEQAVAVTGSMGSSGHKPVVPDLTALEAAPYWQDAFKYFVTTLSPHLPEAVAQALAEVKAAPAHSLARMARDLLKQNYQEVEAGVAVLMEAALSVYWSQAVAIGAELVQPASMHSHSEPAMCPCCGSPAVGGLVLTGDREGLRYLQCSLCETRWHAVRATCCVCNGTQHIDYWTSEKTDEPIQIETCGDCHSYLKIFRLDREPFLDAVADDLASQMLDAAIEGQGFSRAGINPFSLPS